MILSMAMEILLTKTVQHIQDFGKKIDKLDKEFILITKEINMKGNSKTE